MADPQIQIPLSGGPNESIDPRQLPPGSVIAVRNAIYDQDGSYQPRMGYTALAGGSPPGVRALYNYLGGLYLLDASASSVPQLWAWDGQGPSWRATDTIPPYQATRLPLAASSSAFLGQDIAVYSDYRVVAWIDGTDALARIAIFSVSTGATVLPTTVLSATTYGSIRVGVLGSTAVIVASQRTAARIDGYTLALNPLGSVSSATQIDRSDMAASRNGPFEAIWYNVGNGLLVLAYEGTSSTIKLCSYSHTLGFATETSTSITASGITCFGGATDGTNLWLAFFAGTSSYSTGLLSAQWALGTLVLGAGPFALTVPSNLSHGFLAADTSLAGCCIVSATSAMAIFSAGASSGALDTDTGSTRIVWATAWQTCTTSGLSGSSAGATNCLLASAPLYDASTAQTLCLLMAAPVSATMSGKEMSGSSSVATTTVYVNTGGTLSLCALESSGVDYWATVAPQIAQLNTAAVQVPRLIANGANYETLGPVSRTSGRLGIDAVVFSKASAATVGATLGREFYLNGFVFDHQRASEAGFAHAPPPFGQHDTSGAPTNTYQYAVTYAYVDAAGNLEESAPFFGQPIVSSSPPQMSLTVPAIHLTRKARPGDSGSAHAVYIVVYRTQALENGDPTLYRVTAIPFPSGNISAFTSDVITISDAFVTDATIASNAPLYTVSGELQHDAPEQLHGIVAHGNRIYGIGADNRTVWVSQAYEDGALPAWSLSVLWTLDDPGEDVTALGSFQDKICIFTARRVYVLYGDGPAPSGSGATWNLPPQRLPAVAGCIDPRSVVLTTEGLVYQGRRGLEIVQPSLVAVHFGEPVAVTTKGLVCSSAVVTDNESIARFTFTSSDTFASQSSGLIVAYDFRRQRWTYHYPTASPAASTLGYPYAAAFTPSLGYVQGGNLDALGSAHTASIARENTSADATPWLDFGSYFVPLSVTTAWIKSADLQGWQRVRRIRALLAYGAPHGLSFALNYDYQAQGESHAWTDSQVSALVSGSWEQVRVTPGQGKSEALQLTMATTAPTVGAVGTGQGAAFVGLAFEILAKQGGYRNLGAGAKS